MPVDPTAVQSQEGTAGASRLTQRNRRFPRHLTDSIIMKTVGERPLISNKMAFKQNMFYPIIDRMISEFDKRFESIQCNIMKGIEALNPQADKFLDLQLIEKFATVYSSDIEDLKHEVHQIKGLLRRTEDKKTIFAVNPVNISTAL